MRKPRSIIVAAKPTRKDGEHWGDPPKLAFDSETPNTTRACADCAQVVEHRAVKAIGSLFTGTLWRPVRHCPKCGFAALMQEDEPGGNRMHMSQDCRDHKRAAEKPEETVDAAPSAFGPEGAYEGK